MNKDGDIYAAENPPEEDVKRLKEWGDEIEAEELERHRKKLEELEAALVPDLTEEQMTGPDPYEGF